MAFVSANLVKFREMADSGSRSASKILKLQQRPQYFLTAVLIGNNIVNIIATAILTYWLGIFGHANEWLVTIIMAPIFIILCEMVPKDYGRLHSQTFLLRFSGFLNAILRIFEIPLRLTIRSVDFFLGPLGTAIDRSIFVSEKEFRFLIDESAKSGVLAHHEKQLIDTIMDFGRIDVESVMIPVERAAKIEITGTLGQVKDIARSTQARMILVYEEIEAIIVGMVYVFDVLFEEKESEGLKNFLRSPVFLPRKTSIEKAFLTLQEKRQSFAAVTDSDGEVIGVVAIEKLLAVA
jgi:putative hemolysin